LHPRRAPRRSPSRTRHRSSLKPTPKVALNPHNEAARCKCLGSASSCRPGFPPRHPGRSPDIPRQGARPA
jgi:hypothetical protein